MVDMVAIAITILKHKNQYLFLKRRKAPYENLWSLVGGKVDLGEHIMQASIREAMEETGTTQIIDYEYRGLVSERLVQSDGTLLAHFLIFVGFANIPDFQKSHREGELMLFTDPEIEARGNEFLPSDLHMFKTFKNPRPKTSLYEAELIFDGSKYTLEYYRKAEH
ncbi:MAG: NUDIX domain-containing protein [Candidatus Lokiarchaeota archaeon]|nr:NUDIX domain-containing protein [Candidatus Lokiarchaeota archaeon]